VRYTEFFFLHESDVIIVTSLVLRTQSASEVFLHNSPSVKQHCELQEKWTSSTSKPV